MGKQHLDLFAQPPRGPALSGFSDLSRHIACALVDGARHLPRRRTRTALELEGASCAVVFAGAVEHRCIVIHQSARGGQLLQASKSSSKHEIADGSAAAQSERTPSVERARSPPSPGSWTFRSLWSWGRLLGPLHGSDFFQLAILSLSKLGERRPHTSILSYVSAAALALPPRLPAALSLCKSKYRLNCRTEVKWLL